jgi:hypothetical protein
MPDNKAENFNAITVTQQPEDIAKLVFAVWEDGDPNAALELADIGVTIALALMGAARKPESKYDAIRELIKQLPEIPVALPAAHDAGNEVIEIIRKELGLGTALPFRISGGKRFKSMAAPATVALQLFDLMEKVRTQGVVDKRELDDALQTVCGLRPLMGSRKDKGRLIGPLVLDRIE